MDLEDAKNIVEIVAFFAAALWFLANAFLRGQMDAAVDFSVDVAEQSATSSGQTASEDVLVELNATIKNVGNCAAGVDAVHWHITEVTDSRAELTGDWLPPDEQLSIPYRSVKHILTQNATWRFAKVVKLKMNSIYFVEGWCHLGLQPASKVARYQKVFSTAQELPIKRSSEPAGD
jgi:hypothetical protein